MKPHLKQYSYHELCCSHNLHLILTQKVQKQVTWHRISACKLLTMKAIISSGRWTPLMGYAHKHGRASGNFITVLHYWFKKWSAPSAEMGVLHNLRFLMAAFDKCNKTTEHLIQIDTAILIDLHSIYEAKPENTVFVRKYSLGWGGNVCIWCLFFCFCFVFFCSYFKLL